MAARERSIAASFDRRIWMTKSSVTFWLLFLSGIALILSRDWSPGTKAACVVGLLLLVADRWNEKAHLYILYQLGLNSRPLEKWRLERKPSYRASVRVWLRTDDILRILISKAGPTAEEDVRAYFKQDERRWDASLLRHSHYNFHHFHDAMSGMDQIWSDVGKTFVDSMEDIGEPLGEFGHLFGPGDKSLWEKYKDTTLTQPMSISPECVVSGPSDELFDVMMNHERTIVFARFPYQELVDLLVAIGNYMHGCEKAAFKTLPKNIQATLDEYRFLYDPEEGAPRWSDGSLFNRETAEDADYFNSTQWARTKGIALYRGHLEEHVFKNEYVTIRLQVELFFNDQA